MKDAFGVRRRQKGAIRAHVTAVALVLAMTAIPALAQPAGAPESDTVTADMEERLVRSVEELDEILRARGISDERAAALALEIDTIRKDRAEITAALIAAAKTERKLGEDIIALQDEIVRLETEAQTVRIRLWERRDVLAEVLAALQRMGLNPPPAIVVQPEDALSSVRSAILLGAVVPQMRAETEALIADLDQLSAITVATGQEQERLETARIAQAEEQTRLTVLVEEKRALEERTADALESERQTAEALAAQAGNLQQLIMSLEQEIEAARQAAERAQREAEEAERQARLAREQAEREAQEAAEREQREARERLEAARLAERQAQERLSESRQRAQELAERQLRIAPSEPFANQRGQLAKPAAGRTITAFGGDDGLGGTASGDTLETVSDAIVTAPADGWILYAGPFRSFGNLLILDVGDGYHIVLAGMDRIEVGRGQFVAGGEPVGVMGSVRLAGVTAAAAENDNPTLYIEFRKDGTPIDPAPWWERISAGRT